MSLLEKLGLRKSGKFTIRRADIQDISEAIQSLEDEFVLQCSVIERHAGEIAFSKDKNLIETAVSILVNNSHYQGLQYFLHGKHSHQLVMQMSPEKKIGFAHHLLDTYGSGYVTESMGLLEGIAGEPEKARLKKAISKRSFYDKNPITAVKAAVSLDDYELVGLTFAHLREKAGYLWSSNENREIKEFRASRIDVKRYEGLPKLIHDACSAGNKEEEKALREEADSLHKKLVDGYDALLAGMEDQRKALDAVGDALLEYEDHISSDETRKGDYRMAMEYFIKSRNVNKVFETAKKTNGTKETPGIYSDSVTAFTGFKALLTEFADSSEMNAELREQAIEELKETFRPYWAYRHSLELAIEAAALTGDFTALRDNFYRSLEHGYAADPKVYDILKAQQAVDDDKVIEMVNDYLKKELDKERSIFSSRELPRVSLCAQPVASCV